MRNFIIINNINDDRIIININQIIDICPVSNRVYINLVNGHQVVAKITFEEIVELINKAQN